VRGLPSPRITRNRFSGGLSCLAWLTSLGGVAITIGYLFALRDLQEVAFGLTPLMKGMLTATQFFAGLVALTLIGSMIAWRKGYWRIAGRLHYSLVALAGIGYTWFLYYWNLLPHNFS
jgi:hypothetical protein